MTKARNHGKAEGGRMMRRLIAPDKLECGHSTFFSAKVQRCHFCEMKRDSDNRTHANRGK